MRPQTQLAAADVVVGEYLFVWRTAQLPFFGPEWELRYIVLAGTTLK